MSGWMRIVLLAVVVIIATCKHTDSSTTRTPQQHEAACNDGDLRSCYVLGALYRNGRAVPRDYARAADLFQRACANADRAEGAIACFDLGVLYETGHGVPYEPRRARELIDGACSAGLTRACDHFR